MARQQAELSWELGGLSMGQEETCRAKRQPQGAHGRAGSSAADAGQARGPKRQDRDRQGETHTAQQAGRGQSLHGPSPETSLRPR